MSEQPEPRQNAHDALWPTIIRRMQERHERGLSVYKTPLQPFNGRDFLRDLQEELLDAVVYLEGMRVEWEAMQRLTTGSPAQS